MIEVTMKFSNYSDAAAVLARISEGCIGSRPVDNTGDYAHTVSTADVGQHPDYVAPSTAEAPKRTRKARTEPVNPPTEPAPIPSAAMVPTEQVVANAKAVPVPAKQDVPQVTHSAIDYATDVAPVITRAAQHPGFGPSKTLAVLKSYGASKGSEVNPDRLGDLKLELEEALAALEVSA